MKTIRAMLSMAMIAGLIGVMLSLPPMGLAQTVNGISTTNTTTGNPPVLSSTGTDVNIGLKIQTTGTGTIQHNTSSGVHMEYRQGVSATVTGAAAGARCTDARCILTATSSTSMLLTFAQAFTNAPVCIVLNSTHASAVPYTVTTTGVLIASAQAFQGYVQSDVLNVYCDGLIN